MRTINRLKRFELAALAPGHLPRLLGHSPTFEAAQEAGDLEHKFLKGRVDLRILDLKESRVWFRYANTAHWIPCATA